MVARALPGNLADVMVEGVAIAAGGAALRLAWDRDDNIGLVATGGFILAGIVLPMFAGRNQMVGIISDGLFRSGAAIAGWITAEKVLGLDKPSAQAELNPGYRRPALNAGAKYTPSYNGARQPEVALQGINPNTGEVILDSRI